MIGCFVSNKFNTVFEYLCDIDHTEAIHLCFAFMASHSFPTLVGKKTWAVTLQEKGLYTIP